MKAQPRCLLPMVPMLIIFHYLLSAHTAKCIWPWNLWETRSSGAFPIPRSPLPRQEETVPSPSSAAARLSPRGRRVAAVARRIPLTCRGPREPVRVRGTREGVFGLQRSDTTDVTTGAPALPSFVCPHCAFLLTFASRLGQDEQ